MIRAAALRAAAYATGLEALESRVLFTTALPAFQPIAPLGSLVYSSNLTDAISVAGETDSFTFAADPGQTVTVIVEPQNAPGLNVNLALKNPSSATIATASANGAGQREVIQTAGPTTSGTYTIDVTSVAGTGAYKLTAILNAATDNDTKSAGANDTTATAQNIDSSFVDLGNGGARGAVSGSIGTVYKEGFEGGTTLPTGWASFVGDAHGRVRVGSYEYWTASGANALVLDRDAVSGNLRSLAEATWTVDLTGAGPATLSFYYRLNEGGIPAFSGNFTGHANASGVAISADGTNWHPIWNATQTSNYSHASLDLSAAAAAAGIALGPNVRIRFQHYSAGSTPNGGMLIDEVSITRADSDVYAFTLNAGQHTDLAVRSRGFAAAQLQLLDSAFNVVATAPALPGASNFDAAVSDFVAPSSGTYYARVTGNPADDYTLEVSRGARLDIERNSSIAEAAALGANQNAVGWVNPVGSNRLFTVEATQAGGSSFGTPVIRELDPVSGQVIRTLTSPIYFGTLPGPPAGQESASFGLVFTGTSLLVGAGANNPIYELDPNTGATIRTIPNPGALIAGLAVNNGEIYVSNNNGGTRIYVLDYATGSVKRVFNSAGQETLGNIAGDLVYSTGDSNGNSLYRIDPASGIPRAIYPIASYSAGGTIGNQMYAPRLFNRDVDVYDVATGALVRSIVTTQNVFATGAMGDDRGDYYSFHANAGDNFTLSTTTPGDGSGQFANALNAAIDLYDANGNLIATNDDGAADGRNALLQYAVSTGGTFYARVRSSAGSGEYVLHITGNNAPAATPLTFALADPRGGAVYASSASGQLNYLGQTDRYSLSLDAGQTVTVSLRSSVGLIPKVELFDPSNNSLGVVTTAAAGKEVFLQTITAAQAGTYTLVISSTSASAGTYSANVLLNQAVEAEAHGSPTLNDTRATAQNIDGSFINLGDGASRGSVAGKFTSYSDSFESGNLSSQWSTYSVLNSGGPAPMLGVSTQYHSDGSYALVMTNAANEATWTVDLSRVSNATLSLSYLSTQDDGLERFNGPFVGHVIAHGIAISNDGNQWYPVLNTASASGGSWQAVNIDLGAAAAAAGIQLGPNFQIRLQAAGSGTRAWDNVRITSTDNLNILGEDWYSFTASAGQPLTVALKTSAGVAPQFELYGPTGLIQASSVAATLGFDQIVEDFVPSTGGTYYARVIGTATADYSLLVTRGASVSTAPLSPLQSPQDISGSMHVLGRAGTGMGRLFVLASKTSVREIDPASGQTIQTFTVPAQSDSGQFNFGIATTPTSLLVAGQGGTIYELNPDSGQTIRTVANTGVNVTGMAYLSGQIFVLGNNQLRVIDYATGSLVRTVSTTFSGGGLAASATKLYTVGTPANSNLGALFEVNTQTGALTLVATLKPEDIAFPFAPSVIGNELLVSIGNAIRVYDLNTLQLKRSFNIASNVADLGGDGQEPGPAWYSFRANAGDHLVITTGTPGDGPNEFANTLDPILELYAPNGSQVATDDNDAADGRNARIVFDATATGTYRVRLRSAGGAGEFLLSVAGSTAQTSAFTVSSTSPANGETVNSVPSQITVNFSGAVDASTLAASDLTVNGQAATGFHVVDSDTVVFDLSTLDFGMYRVNIAKGAITSQSGTPLQAFVSQFNVNVVGPRVIASSIQQGGVYKAGDKTFTFQFDRPIVAANLDTSDFSLVGPWAGSVSPSSWNYNAGSSTLTLNYTRLPEDIYTLTLRSGNGRFEAPDGANLDGEAPAGAMPPNQSGDGVPGGDFVVNFTLDAPLFIPATLFQPLTPYGSGAYQYQVDAGIGAAGEIDSYAFNLDPGQAVTIVVQPLQVALNPNITLRNPSNAIVASADTGAANKAEFIQTFNPTVAGTYTVQVGGTSSTTGTYRLYVLLNSAAEAETYGGASNNTTGTAQSLSNGWVDLGGGVSRTDVSGHFTNSIYTTETFENGSLGAAWMTYSANTDGTDYGANPETQPDFPARIEVRSDLGTSAGKYALIEDRWMRVYDESNQLQHTLNEATWTVNLNGKNTAYLNFAHVDFGDSPDAFAGNFANHANADGIAISTDGVNWKPIWNAPDQPDGQWLHYSLDLKALATAAGLSMTSNFRIKFQQYGEGYSPLGGRGWDDLSITNAAVLSNAADYYSVALTAGQKIFFGVSTTLPLAHASLSVLDSTGKLLAGGKPGANNFDEYVDGFVAPSTGTYYIQITGDPIMSNNSDYRVVVVRGAEFGRKLGLPWAETSHDINLTGNAIGSVGVTPMNRLFSFNENTQKIEEVDLGTGASLRQFNLPVDGQIAQTFGAKLATTASTLLVSQYDPFHLVYIVSEVDPSTGATLRTMNLGSPVTSFLENEMFGSGPQGINVYDYQTGALKRTISITGAATSGIGAIFTSGADLMYLTGNVVYKINKYTGAATSLGTIDAAFNSNYAAAVIGTELYTVDGNSSTNAWDLIVYDLGTLARKRVIKHNTTQASLVDELAGDGGNADADAYNFNATVGNVITISTSTFGDGVREFANPLDPAIDVYDPDGQLVAYDDNSAVDGHNALLTFTAAKSGAYTVQVRSANGMRGDYVVRVSGNTFTQAPFAVASSTPVDNATLSETPTQAIIHFSNDVLLSSLSAGDLTVDGRAATGFTVIDSKTVSFKLPALGIGNFTLAIAGGAITDLQGRALAAFTSHVNLPAQPQLPVGSLIYSRSTQGQIASAGGSETIPLELDGAQTVTIILHPSPALQGTIELRDPNNVLLGSATGAAAGADVLLQNIPAAIAGAYSLKFIGASSTQGSYAATMMLNASEESELHGGTSNDAPANAQNIDGSFIDVGGGSKRGAVSGILESGKSTPVISESFESGTFGPAWKVNSPASGAYSYAEVSNKNGAADGSYALLFRQTNPNVGPTLLEADWTVDLSNQHDLVLNFAYADNINREAIFTGDFTNHALADGIAISDDGVHWHPLFQSPSLSTTAWTPYSVDLSGAIQRAGLTFAPTFKIRFQSYGGGGINNYEGFDNIQIAVPHVADTYKFTANAGESISIGLKQTNELAPKVQIVDASGNLLAAGVAGSTYDQAIRDFKATSGGTYYVRVVGAEGARYSLVVNRNLALPDEPNNTPAQAQDVGSSGAVISTIGYEMGRLFAYRLTDHLVLEIDPSTGAIINSFTTPAQEYFNPQSGFTAGPDLATTPSTLLIGGLTGDSIYEVNPDTGAVIRAIPNTVGSISRLAFLRNEIFASVSPTGRIAVLDYATGTLKRYLDTSIINGLAASPRGLIGINAQGVVQVDPINGQTRQIGRVINGTSAPIGVVGNELFIGTDVYDLATLQFKRTLNVANSQYISGVGADGSFNDDNFAFHAQAGDALNLRTYTPADGSLEFTNDVNPVIELYDPDGILVAIADNNAPDGHNAILNWSAAKSGMYKVHIFAASGSGEYALKVSGNSPATAAPFTASPTDIQEGAVFTTVPTFVTIHFSAPIQISSLQPGDLLIDGAAAQSFDVLDGQTIRFYLPPIPWGLHQITMNAGSVSDVRGNALQAFTLNFISPAPFKPIGPLGSLVYQMPLACSIPIAGYVVSSLFRFDPGQRVSIAVTPSGALQPKIELLDASNNVVAIAQAAAAGQGAVLQSVALSGGVYTIRFSGASNSTGTFDSTITLNAAIETEVPPTGSNDDLASAQDLSAAGVNVGGGVSVTSVLGNLTTHPGIVPLSDDFESQTLGPAWSTYSSTAGGRIQVTNGWGSAEGDFPWVTYALDMDYATGSQGLNLNEAVWTVDLTNIPSPRLVFYGKSFGDAVVPFAGDFTGHYNADGVAISADGVHWHPVWDPTNKNFGTWTRFEVDLAGAAAAAGMPLGANFKIKFQEYGTYFIDADGRGWDKISIVEPDIADQDFYKLPLSAGQPTTITLSTLNGAAASVQLLDSGGNVVATGAAGANGSVISDFVSAAGGNYYVRVFGGASGTTYSLVTSRGATLESEPNDSLATAQPIGASGNALGGGTGSGTIAPISTESEPNDDGDNVFDTADFPFADDLSGSFLPIGGNNYRATFTGQLHGNGTNPEIDVFKFHASAGDNVTNHFLPQTTQNTYVTLLDSAGNLITQNTPGGTSVFNGLPKTDTYYLVLSSYTNVSYTMELTLTTPKLYGVVDDDYYSISAQAGTTLIIGTSTPADGSGEFTNNLDPVVSLYDSAGNLLAADDNSSADGRNASLSIPITATGTYKIRVSAKAGTLGIYELTTSAAPTGSGQMAIGNAGSPSTLVLGGPSGGGTSGLQLTSSSVTQQTAVANAFVPIYPNVPTESSDTSDGHEQALTAGYVSGDARWLAVRGHSDPVVTVDEYTLNLAAGTKIDAILDGADGADFSDARVDLIAPNGTTVLASSGASTGFDQAILGFGIQTSGTYTLRLTTRADGDYYLAVGDRLVIDTEPNASTDAPLRSLDGTRGAIGSTGGADSTGDAYHLTLASGQSISFSTETLFENAGNTLNPKIVVLNAQGQVLASDLNSAADGKNAKLDFTAPADGVYTVQVIAETGQGLYRLKLSAGGAEPIANPGGPYNTNEGTNVSLTSAGSSDPDGQIVKYEWDFNYDGANFDVDATGASVNFPAPDGPLARTIALRVTDNSGLTTIATTTLNVANVDPKVAINGAATVSEGSNYTLTLGAITDPGTDTVSQYVVHWGDGTSSTYTTAGAKTHVFADGAASEAITVDLVDEDGTHLDAATAPLSVNVQNVAPTVNAGADVALNTGATFSASESFIDPGTADTFTATVDYADGAGAQTLTLGAGNTFNLSKAYNTPGTYNVVVTITDDDGGIGTDTVVVTVSQPVGPTYTSVNIGTVGNTSGTNVITAGSAYDVTAGGNGAWNTKDNFRFVYAQRTGDFDVKVRVAGLSGGDAAAAQAGLMARETLDPASRNALVYARPDARDTMQWRSSTGGTTDNVTGAAGTAYPNNWIRLQRVGNVITSYRSADGTNWAKIASVTFTTALPSVMYVGLAASAKNASAAALTAQFRGLADNGVVQPPPDTTPPATPSGLGATPSTSGIALDWANNTETDLAGYNVYRSSSLNGTYTKLNTSGLLTSSDYNDTAAPVGVASFYRVTAVDTTGNESTTPASTSATRPAQTDLTPPATPSGLGATPSTSGIALDWANNTETDLAGYNVYRSSSLNGTYTKLNTSGLLTSSDYNDTAAPSGVASFYRVTAVDTTGNESTTPASTSATRPAQTDLTPPATPTGLGATPSTSGIALDWSNNTETDLAGYNVYRRNPSTGQYDKLNTGGLLTSSDYNDTAATPGVQSDYRVTAVDTSGNESTTPATISATRPANQGVTYTSANIGTVGNTSGTNTITDGSAYDVTAGGNGVWNTKDNFRFVYAQKTGDFDIKVRVANLSGGDATTAQAGLMVRESLDPASREAMVYARPDARDTMQWRGITSGTTDNVTGAAGTAYPNNWIRLQRVGNTITSYRSADGVTWTKIGAVTFSTALPSTLYVGLAVSAKNTTSAPLTAQFRDLSLT